MASWLGLTLSAAAAAAAGPGEVLHQIDTARLDAGAAVRVDGRRVELGAAVLHIEHGTVYPASEVAGRPVEAVFVGSARLTVEPPDAIEAGQLELFTGQVALNEPIDEAALAFWRPEVAERLLAGPRALADVAETERARELFRRWKTGAERKLLGVSGALLTAALGDPVQAGYLAGRFHSARLGGFLLVLDPDARESMALGQFVALEATERGRRRLRRHIHRQQRKGRLIGLELEELGLWNTWTSFPEPGTTAADRPGAAFEPEHYRIDVRVDDREREPGLAGEAEIRLRATGDGRRVVELELHADLHLEAVSTSAGEPLFFHLERGIAPLDSARAKVVLPAAASRDERVTIVARFRGALLERVRKRTYFLRETLAWHPHAGDKDRATYDVTLHLPRELDLAAAGRLVRSGREADGRRWERYRLDRPSAAFGFEIGDFRFRRLSAGRVDVDVAFGRVAAEAPKRNQAEVARTARDSLLYFEELFGSYPLDRLTVVTTPREYSQGLPGFVSLASSLMFDYRYSDWYGIEDRRTVVAHEVAHQWWGNLVGWKSYRDEWIAEAMANYAAMVWARNRLPRGRQPSVGPADHWRSSLATVAANGRPVEALGPLVLGRRLYSSHSLDAYESIVYKKGAVVVNMLDYLFGERPFLHALGRLVGESRGRLISTADFFTALEQYSRSDLAWFYDQYVYGTGMPEVYYSYEFLENDDGGWRVRGEVRQRTPFHYTYRVVRTPGGGYDVRREAYRELDVSRSSLVVPVHIAVHDPERARLSRRPKRALRDRTANSAVVGRLMQHGERYEFEVELDYEPKSFWLDRDERTFARFFSEHHSPKRTLLYEGFDALARSDYAAAEERWSAALHADVAVPPPGGGRVDSFLYDWEARYLDAMIHANLAWVYMDLGRLEDARAEIRRAEQAPHSFTRARMAAALEVLDARLGILREEHDVSLRRLRRALLRERSLDRTDAWALLAVAAHAAGDEETLASARRAAVRRGIDISALERAHAGD